MSDRAKLLRFFVPILGCIALGAMFVKLPELAACKHCSPGSPFFPFLGAAYFSLLIGLDFLFPWVPQGRFTKLGILWSILLIIGITYFHYPYLCGPCFIAHGCNLLIWIIWMVAPARKRKTSVLAYRERFYLLIFGPIAIVALYGSLNLTLLVYGFKARQSNDLNVSKLQEVIEASEGIR